jgi:hypothetical protein
VNSVVGRPLVLHVGAPSSQHLLASFPHATVSAPGRSWFDVVTRDLRALGCEGVPVRLAEVLSVPSIGQSEVAGAGVSCAVEGMGGVPVPAAAGRGVLAAHRHPIVVTCSPVSEEMTIFGFRVQEPPGQSLHTHCSSIMMPCRSLHSHAVLACHACGQAAPLRVRLPAVGQLTIASWCIPAPSRWDCLKRLRCSWAAFLLPSWVTEQRPRGPLC